MLHTQCRADLHWPAPSVAAGEAQETALAQPAKRSKKAGAKKAGAKAKKAAAPAWVGQPSGQAKGRTMYAKARVAGCEVTPGCVVALAADDDEEEQAEGAEALAPLGLVQCLFEQDGEKKVQVGAWGSALLGAAGVDCCECAVSGRRLCVQVWVCGVLPSVS
jgi:hypothetical protein